jgi:hypothetical protein
MKFFNPKRKQDTVSLLLDNLLWGKVTIDTSKLASKQEGLNYSKEFYHHVDRWQKEILCPDTDRGFRNRLAGSLYDAILKGRSYGVIVGELHDKTSEDRIKELEQEVKSLKKDNITLARELKNVTRTRI